MFIKESSISWQDKAHWCKISLHSYLWR